MKKWYWYIIGLLMVLAVAEKFYYDHKLSQASDLFKEQITVLKDSISSLESQEYKIIEKGSNNTQKANNKKKEINNKLSNDEKAIDSVDVDDADIKEFLSKYHERQRDH